MSKEIDTGGTFHGKFLDHFLAIEVQNAFHQQKYEKELRGNT